MDSLLDSLTPAQREAVQHVDGPLLILAGPGSGKTRVVTRRIAYLLRQRIAPSEILALTFTNKAAEEMRGRLTTLAPHQRVWVSTFHRLGSQLLRRYGSLVGLAPNFTIYDASDSRQVLRRVLKEVHGTGHTLVTPQRIGAAISRFKNNLIPATACTPRQGDPAELVAADIYPHYQARLLASSAVDFDDLLLHLALLLRDNPELRATLDERFRYVLVDEYQDTNRAQYVILRALSHVHRNLAATGDPDQSIYGWRGANLGNILEFERDFPDVRVVRLEQNWRSSRRILRVADRLIAYNTRRKEKRLVTDNPEGRPVRLVTYPTPADEAADITRQIADGIRQGSRRPSDYAIFYRLNALSRALEMALSHQGIPFQLVNAVAFYQRQEIKDVLAYATLVNNPHDDVAFLRIVNVPARGIGKTTLQRLAQHAARQGLTLLDAARQADRIETLSKRAAKQLAKFVALIDRIAPGADGPVATLLDQIIDATRYRELYLDSELEVDLNRLANIDELLLAAHQFDEQQLAALREDTPDGGTPQGDPSALETFLEKAALVSDTDALEDEDDKVTLMTLHAAKGLEFPVVFLVGAEEGLLPHQRSLHEIDRLEEERRLMFVGITRAAEELQISYVERRALRGWEERTIPSGFLMELPRGEMEVARGRSCCVAEGAPPCWAAEDPALAPDEPRPARPARRARGSAAVTTAARLAGQTPAAGPHAPVEAFVAGMAVMHPEYGPGKVIAIDGRGANRKATVTFPTAGKKRFVLAQSTLRPARGQDGRQSL